MSHEFTPLEQFDPLTIKDVNLLQTLRGWFNKEHWSTPKGWIHSFMLFLETVSFWKKTALALFISIPLIIAGSIVPLISLVLVGSAMTACFLSIIGIFEYYKYRHQKEKQQFNELCSVANETIDTLHHNEQQLKQDHYNMVSSHVIISESLHSSEVQKKLLEEKIKELQKREDVISALNEGLAVERDALKTIITEKDKKYRGLTGEFDLLNKEKEVLTTQCTQLVSLTEQQDQKLLSQSQQKNELTVKLHSLYKQRRFLVDKIHCQQNEIESLIFLRDQLKKEVCGLHQRISGLNTTLVNQVTLYNEVIGQLTAMTEEVLRFKNHNALLAEQIKVLVEQREFLATKVKELHAIEKELQDTKKGLESTINELFSRINEQQALLCKQQLEAQHTLNEYQASQHKLNKTLVDLDQVKKSVAEEIKQIKAAQSPLITVVDLFSSQMIANEEKQQAFMQRLNLFLASKDIPMEQFILELQRLNQELSGAASDIKELNARHSEALKTHEGLMTRLKVVASNPSPLDSGIFKP